MLPEKCDHLWFDACEKCGKPAPEPTGNRLYDMPVEHAQALSILRRWVSWADTGQPCEADVYYEARELLAKVDASETGTE